MPYYICFEGSDGVFKTTTSRNLSKALIDKGFRVLETKEPGCEHLPLTMELRRIMLDRAYDTQLTSFGRECIAQASRSCHLERLILPALNGRDYEYIVQDRGLLSGMAYAEARGVDKGCIEEMHNRLHVKYDLIVYLNRNAEEALAGAKASKNEFIAGDAMESKGVAFQESVQTIMQRHIRQNTLRSGVVSIDVVGKSENALVEEIMHVIAVRNVGNNGTYLTTTRTF